MKINITRDENGRIIDAVKRIDMTKSAVRQILPGFPYSPPPKQDKPDLTDADTLEIVDNIPVIIEPNTYNRRYLETKRTRMGHKL